MNPLPRRLSTIGAIVATGLLVATVLGPSVAATHHTCGVFWAEGGPDALCRYPKGSRYSGTRCEAWISQHTPLPPCLNPIPG